MKEINKNLVEKCGIYIITNIENGHRYIGSAKNLYERLKHHKRDLNKGSHPNQYLQNAWNKYKEDNFEYGIIEYCNENNRLEKENFYINLLFPEYNINGVNLDSVLDHSEETKEKISNSIKECYINGKLESIKCYIYSIFTWELVKECYSVNEASEFLGMKNSVRSNILEHRLFKNEFIIRLHKFNSKIDLMNDVCKNIITYRTTENITKYLIGEKDGIRKYYRSTNELVSSLGVSSPSTIKKHPDATVEHPFIPRNTNIKIYWSKEFIPYEPSDKVI